MGTFLSIKKKMVENFEDNSQHERSPEEFYSSLKTKLDENHNFPEDYVFKFIIPGNSEKITEILRVFDGMKYTLSNRDSKNGKYTSLTINAFVMDSAQVIDLYKKVAEVEGVMML